MPKCQGCQKQVRGKLNRTVTGRQLCDACNDRLVGAAAGMIGAGPEASTTQSIVSAVATSRIFARLRKDKRDGGRTTPDG